MKMGMKGNVRTRVWVKTLVVYSSPMLLAWWRDDEAT